MKKKFLLMLVAVLALSVFVIPVMSDVSIGVNIGDWFVYSMSVNQTILQGTFSGSWVIPVPLRDYYVFDTYVNTYRLNRTVTAVDAATGLVNFTETYTNLDATTTTKDVTSNVSACDIFWRVIPSGLVDNDTLEIATPQPPGPIPPSATDFRINNTFSKTYEGGARTTCNMTLGPDVDLGDGRTTFNASYEWDQTTGILAVANVSLHYTLWTLSEGISVFTTELLYTSVWTANTIPNYDLTIAVDGTGTTDPAVGTYSYPDGTIVDVTAYPSIDYKLSHWLLDSVDVGSANPKAVLVNGTHTLTAVFVWAPQVWLNISIVGTGSVDPDVGSYQYEMNSAPVIVTATDVLGWTFDHWLLNGTDVGSTNPYSHTPDGNYTLAAVFVSVPVRELTIAVTGGGSVDPDVGSYQYNNGTVVAVTASDVQGWGFDHWLLNGTDVGSTNPYNVTMDSNQTLAAVFNAIPQAWLTITVQGTGTTNPVAGTHQYDQGTNVTVAATSPPSTGWVFDHWLLDTENAGSDNSITVLMDENHTLTAVYVEYPLTVGVYVGDWSLYEATYWSTGDQSIQLGSYLNATFATDYNWTLQNRTITSVDGVNVGFALETTRNNGTVTLTSVTEDVTDNNDYFVVLADKGAGDWLITWFPWGSQFPQWSQTIIVNETVMMDFGAGGAREVNHADWLDSTFGNGEAWWDKESGILVRYEYNYTITDTGSGSSRTFLFTSTLIDARNAFWWWWRPNPPQRVGVAVGDWFFYSFDVQQTSSDPSFVAVPDGLSSYLFWNETVSLNRTVISVSRTTVTFEDVWRFKNGGVTTTTLSQNVEWPSSVFWTVIPHHMDAGEVVKAGGFYINETVLKTYSTTPPNQRETSVMSYVSGSEALLSYTYNWDYVTGILVDANITGYVEEGDQNATTTFTTSLVDSNVIPEFSTGTMLLFVFVAVTVCVSVYGRKRLKRRIG